MVDVDHFNDLELSGLNQHDISCQVVLLSHIYDHNENLIVSLVQYDDTASLLLYVLL